MTLTWNSLLISKIKKLNDGHEFFTRFKIIRGLNFPTILGMNWWCQNKSVFNLISKHVAVKYNEKNHQLSLAHPPEIVSDFK